MNSPENSIILWNLRSLYNVGAITRSAVSFGLRKIYCVGSTPYPRLKDDTRLPHVYERATEAIHKTALGAEVHAEFEYYETIDELITYLRSENHAILGLEQSTDAIRINDYTPQECWSLLVGEETKGLPQTLLSEVDTILEIDHLGPKSSLNVGAATSIALFCLTSK